MELPHAADLGMTFRDWMEACLYDPDHGYYTKARAASPTGPEAGADYATSPTLHPFMAQCVAREAVMAWEAVGRPEGFAVAEFGGGRGDLARQARAEMARHGLEPEWLHVEIGSVHRAMQAGRGVRHVQGLPDGFVGFVVAHEFLDALPVHLLRSDGRGGWSELWVEGTPPRLAPRAASPQGLAAAPAFTPPEGHVVAANAAARAWMHRIGSALAEGRVMVVDYGADGATLWARDPAWGTVRTFAGHQDAGSPLADPGMKDITASVDFAQLRAWAQDAGLHEVWNKSQEAFLLDHGALDALNAIDRGTVEGASAYLRLRHMLIPHAGGMGDAFRVALFEKGMG